MPTSLSSTSSRHTHSDRERRKRSLTPPPSPSRSHRSKHTETSATSTTTTSNVSKDDDHHRSSPAPLIVTPHQTTLESTSSEPILTRDELNKLNSKLVKARIMGDESEVKALEEEYKRQLERYESAENGTSRVEKVKKKIYIL